MLNVLSSLGRFLLRVPRALLWAAAIVWMAFIWTLSESVITIEEPGPSWSWFSNLAHAPLFGILGLIFTAAVVRPEAPGAWPRLGGRRVGLVLLLVGLYGVVDEWHQSVTPGRDPAVGDLVTDLTGAACVLWIIAFLGREDAGEKGLRWRLLGGILGCGAAALLSTVC